MRDVAELHYKGIKVEEAKNRRFICCGDANTKEQIVAHLEKNFGKLGFKPACDHVDDTPAKGIVVDNSPSR